MDRVRATDTSNDLAVYNDGATVRAVYTRDGNIIHKGLPFVRTATAEDINACNLFYSAYEGTMLHAVYTGDNWILGTNKKLSCQKSKWASKTTTFAQSFENALSKIYPSSQYTTEQFMNDRLDQTKSYIFLVRAIEEERLVMPVDIEHPGAVLLATCTEPGVFNYMDLSTIPEFPRHVVYTKDDVGDNVCQFIESQPYISGVIGIMPDGDVIRVSTPTYLEKLKVRGVLPSLELRALHLMNHARELDLLLNMFPDKLRPFMEVVYNQLDTFCKLYARCFVVSHSYRIFTSMQGPCEMLDKHFVNNVLRDLRHYRFKHDDNFQVIFETAIRERFMRLPGTHKRRLLNEI
ncbi:Immediate-early protein ICP-46 homolog [Scale drop disease virus]|uniref:Immediate-early protein ICP-46 homolog n=1 Tax=Scale drop disease virus TaxID=1697349 RepID=A0A0K1L660_9VIRU|nr:ORF_036L [Scale drop disease virus]AKU37451.1 ORF_036L [Scale drop disease virus]QLI60709.1 Immediate-early protein ICP-46 homolog [Scale drop disease virus]QXJ13627.1 ORF036L [Scale drop disease virus]UNH60746.1 immediate-early protein ICP-46-like protein [Scale drop disease virus]